MATNQGAKGNPASHRMGNQKLKERRKRSWERGVVRKAARIEAQREREARNKRLRADGLPTPWEVRRIDRATRRHPLHVKSGTPSTHCWICVY